jgi:Zn-dependent peptidase ImmA (M78 family)
MIWKSAAARRLTQKAAVDGVDLAVRSLCEKLLEGVPCPPTDLELIGERLNARISSEDLFGSGELRRDRKGYEIVVARDLSLPRRRFTIAHEFGHVVISETGRGAPHAGREVERLCDLLAVQLLMPEQVFRPHLPPKPKISDIFALATLFQTSVSATAQRCGELAKVNVFEASKGKIVWAKGSLRSSDALKDTSLQDHIRMACSGLSGKELIYLSEGGSVKRWAVEYRAFPKSERALFVLERLPLATAGA